MKKNSEDKVEGFYSKYIHRTRLLELTELCTRIFNEVPSAIKGNESLAMLTFARIKQIATSSMEMRYCVDCVTQMIRTAKDVKITHGGTELNPKDVTLITNDPALLKSST